MKNALFRLSKYSVDKNVFNDYTINALQQTASQMDGYLNYACALGGQNGIPTLVSYADHTIPYTQLQGVPVFNTAML